MQEELVEQGVIINSKNGYIDIELLENENCEECSAKLFCNPSSKSTKWLKVKNSNYFEKGEKVNVSILGKNLLGASINLYLYPLLIIVSSIFLGSKLFTNSNHSELYSFLFSILFVSIYYFIFFQMSKKMKYSAPKIVVTKSH